MLSNREADNNEMPNKLNHSQIPELLEQEEFRNLPWLKKISRLEKILCFVTVVSLLMVAVMVTTLAFLTYFYKHSTDSTQNNPISSNTDNSSSSKKIVSDLCLTPGCVKAAAALLSNLDESIDPCSNFYRFACGEWLKTKIIPEDKASAEIYFDAFDKVNLQLKTLMESNMDGTEPSFITKTKEMYQTCMDLKSIEKVGAEPLENILKSLGGWPVVEGRKWNESIFDWVDTLITLRKLGFNHNILVSLSVIVDYRHNLLHTIQLDQTSFGMPDRTYLIQGLNDTSTAAYYKMMVKAAKLLGADEATAEKELLEALEFEMTLANYSLPREERRNVSKIYNKYTIKKLQERAPQVPWLKYINGLLINVVHENETLIVATPKFIRKFADLITKTEKRVIANYILWRVVAKSLPLLSKKYREIHLEYNTVLSGESREKPRWEQCLSKLSFKLEIALGSYYVRHYFKDETREEVSELVKYVRREFLRILDEIDWMDKDTKVHAKAKANNIAFFIGYPKELLNDTAVMVHYQDLTISNDSYFKNVLRLDKWSTDYGFAKLRKPNIRNDWKKHAKAAMVNAFYSNLDNSVEIPAAFLQSPFFDKDLPSYMNFASLGTTIGHEITHGFDDRGRQYDKDGNNVNWWAQETDEHFRKKAQCIVEQYSNYTAENGMKLNGVNTLGENIADHGAVKESYLAYQEWVKDNGPEPLLPGLKYNQNQLFWISGTYEWCSKYRPEELKLRILSFYHSPDEFRIIGPLSNLAAFARDFNCPSDSPMNKKHKCQFW